MRPWCPALCPQSRINQMFEEEKRKLERREYTASVMRRYKKPLMQSAFDLQSRLKQQVRAAIHVGLG